MKVAVPAKFTHRIYDLLGCPHEILSELDVGTAALLDACKAGRFTVLGELSHQFPGGGYTASLTLSQSHLALHTWPEHDYCSIDLFACGGRPGRAEATLLEQFRPASYRRRTLRRGPSVVESNDEPWLRANRSREYYEAYRAKRVLLATPGPPQRIEIIENQELGKALFLDGDIQATTSDEFQYHDCLVHPVVRAHPRARNALIVGGGDGGALREVTRYAHFERITLVDLDARVIEASRQWIPEFAQGAFEDRRVELLFEDFARWTTTRRYDIVIVDLTAPTGPSIGAYERLLTDLERLMAPGGFVSVHSGWWGAASLEDFPAMLARALPRALQYNRWIESFRCFWSFVVAWRHEEAPGRVLQRIAEARHTESSSFEPAAYAREAWLSPPSTHERP